MLPHQEAECFFLHFQGYWRYRRWTSLCCSHRMNSFVTSNEYRVFYAANASQGEQHAKTNK